MLSKNIQVLPIPLLSIIPAVYRNYDSYSSQSIYPLYSPGGSTLLIRRRTLCALENRDIKISAKSGRARLTYIHFFSDEAKFLAPCLLSAESLIWGLPDCLCLSQLQFGWSGALRRAGKINQFI